MVDKIILDMIVGRCAGHGVRATVVVVRERRQWLAGMRIGVVLMVVVVVRVVVRWGWVHTVMMP